MDEWSDLSAYMTWKQINRRYLNDNYTYEEAGLALCKPARDPDHAVALPGSANPHARTSTTVNPPRWHAKRANLEEQLALEIVQQALA